MNIFGSFPKVITPFDFLAEFSEGKSVAFVGNAPDVLTREYGALIDSFDYVVRFNECKLAGFEAQLGERTSILVSNPYAEKRVGQALEGAACDLVICIFQQTRRGDEEAFKRWVGKRKVLYTYCPDLVGVEGSDHSHSFTTGTYGLQLLTRTLRPSKILVTGFSMFATPEQTHYWTNEPSAGLRAHDPASESKVFVNLLNTFRCPVYISSEVRKVGERAGKEFSKHVLDADSLATAHKKTG